MRSVLGICAVLLATVVMGGVALAEDAEDEAELPRARAPLVAVPVGCDAPELPAVVFEGSVIQRDFRTVRWEIVEVRAGDPEAFTRGQLVDVRFGLDGQFLDVGSHYVVAARRDPFLGVLVSRVAPPNEVFGGADVVGLAPAAPECPLVADPARTLNVDGSPIATAVVSTLIAEPGRLAAAVLLPSGIVLLVLCVLALARLILTSRGRELQ